jgi:hypothetical protein
VSREVREHKVDCGALILSRATLRAARHKRLCEGCDGLLDIAKLGELFREVRRAAEAGRELGTKPKRFTELVVNPSSLPEDAGYDRIQNRFMARIPKDVRLFNEYHALIVRVGKEFCRRTPRCRGCPLEPFLPFPGPDGSRPFDKN